MSGKMKVWKVECPFCGAFIKEPSKAMLLKKANDLGWMSGALKGTLIDCPRRCSSSIVEAK